MKRRFLFLAALFIATVMNLNAKNPTTVIPVADNMAATLETLQYVKMQTPTYTSRVVVKSNEQKTLASGTYTCPSLSEEPGAALCIYSGATVIGENVMFKDNEITGIPYYGGAVYCNKASLTLKDFAFVNNSARNVGALYVCEDESSVQLTDGFFQGNSSINDGAAYFEGASTLKNVQFINNTCTGTSDRGAILCLNSPFAATSLTNLKFENNSSGKHGALYVKATPATADSLEFIGNSATEQGGAIYLDKEYDTQSCHFQKQYC